MSAVLKVPEETRRNETARLSEDRQVRLFMARRLFKQVDPASAP